MKPPEPGRPLRFVSAASLFDGHDAAINMIRRLLQSGGAEVVHLGHNRSVADIVRAAIDEDADAIAVSSYQGGHNEYFRYMIDMLREQGAAHIRVVGRRRRHHLARGDRRARGVRRREDLYARGRPPPGPQRHDRGRVRARRTRAAPAEAARDMPSMRRSRQPSRAPSRCSKAADRRRQRRRRAAARAQRSRVGASSRRR